MKKAYLRARKAYMGSKSRKKRRKKSIGGWTL